MSGRQFIAHAAIIICAIALIVRSGTARAQAASTPVSIDTTGWMHAPGGVLVNPACVYQVPNGSTVRANGDLESNGTVITHIPPCPTPLVWTRPVTQGDDASTAITLPPGTTSQGYVEWWQNQATSGEYSLLETEFTVPSFPVRESDNQLIYLFPAIQSAGTPVIILQPVLQWGVFQCPTGFSCNIDTPVGSHSSWTYEAYAVSNQMGVFLSQTSISPAAGDTLLGEVEFVEYVNSSTEMWLVAGNDQSNTGLGTTGFFVEVGTSTEPWNQALAAALESEGNINQNDCNDWPGGASGVNFWQTPTVHNQSGNPVTPTFTPCAEPTTCFVPEYTGRNCNFEASTYGPLFDLFF
jgi:hypothetical protein